MPEQTSTGTSSSTEQLCRRPSLVAPSQDDATCFSVHERLFASVLLDQAGTYIIIKMKYVVENLKLLPVRHRPSCCHENEGYCDCDSSEKIYSLEVRGPVDKISSWLGKMPGTMQDIQLHGLYTAVQGVVFAIHTLQKKAEDSQKFHN